MLKTSIGKQKWICQGNVEYCADMFHTKSAADFKNTALMLSMTVSVVS